MKNSILLISSSAVTGYGYLECNRDAISRFISGHQKLLFVPYAAAPSEWDSYTDKVRTYFATMNVPVTGIHAVTREEIFSGYTAIFVGGGNTFRLLHELQQQNLLHDLREAVLSGAMHYMGSSAGTNLATRSISTTNDMPIVYPTGGFGALNLFTYQINPHYLDPDPTSTHKGETRDQRIAEFHQMNDTPVIGLREGSYISIQPNFAQTKQMFIGGQPGAKIFLKDKEPYEAPRNQSFTL